MAIAAQNSEAEEKRQTRRAYLICLLVFAALGVILIYVAAWGHGEGLAPVALGELAVVGALVSNRAGKWSWALRLAGYGVLVAMALSVAHAHDGFRSMTMLGFPGLLVLSVLLLKTPDYLALASSTLAAVTFLGLAEAWHWLPVVPISHAATGYGNVFVVDVILLLIAAAGALLAREGRRNLAELHCTVEQLAEANRGLMRSEAKYRSFIELAMDAVFVTDSEGAIVEVNCQAEALSGVRMEGLIGMPMLAVLSPGDSGEDPFPLDRLAAGTPIMQSCRIVRPDGSVADVEVHSAVMPEGRILSFCRDITLRERGERERDALREQLTQSQKMESIGRLAGGVAHDFNNLLTVINGYSQLLLAKLGPADPLRTAVSEVHKAGQRATGLTRQLLAFSRKQALDMRALELNRLIVDMQPMLDRLMGENVEVAVALSGAHLAVRADAHQIEQVVMNLVVNARDALPLGGKVRLATAAAERDGVRYALLSVSDNGIGMDEETRQRIFEPFFTTKESGRGTGLGLSMVQGIVEQSGGLIDVASAPGKGSTFHIYLPALQEVVVESGMAPAGPVAGGVERVLVVEDRAEIRDYVVAALEQYGYSVWQAASAAEAIDLCAREGASIDLVLTDLVMPQMGGRELASELERFRPGGKVLFMSGCGDVESGSGEVIAAGLPFIQKPFSPEELAGKIRGVLEARV